eukprot:9473422-Pyramimonas_sp.AAC.1
MVDGSQSSPGLNLPPYLVYQSLRKSKFGAPEAESNQTPKSRTQTNASRAGVGDYSHVDS